MEYPTYILPKDVLWLWCVVVGFIGVFSEEKNVLRFEDEAFPSNMTILNRLITCGNSTWGKFTTPTFTCDDIRVNGLRLAYGYYPGWGVDDHCQETGGNHEFTQLCMKMLKKIGMHHKGIYGAMVNNATCGHIDEERYLLKMSERSRYEWTLMPAGRGWVSSLSCMIRV
ncbi:uncharacterized protein LOC112562723 [Pomacea canaliculata]|uniref:uncharacterized protein LOC112562723 n=1 Tax=Pomacea canaliculata TaxID=400727 RepID=UPI000D73A456|nr:uncharacterized protein LOC112562723 [Pomacea canaliculata]